jgi:hypothetical protein
MKPTTIRASSEQRTDGLARTDPTTLGEGHEGAGIRTVNTGRVGFTSVGRGRSVIAVSDE